MEKVNLSPDHLKRLQLFQAGFGMTVKAFAQLRGEIHAKGLKFPAVLAYVLADIETNINRLNTLITTDKLLNATDNPGWDSSQTDTTEVDSQDRREKAE